MRHLITWLTTIDSPDEDARRRGRTLAILAFSLIALCLVLLPLIPLMTPSSVSFIVLGIAIVCYSVVLALARRGYITASGWLLMTMLILGTVAPLNSSGQSFASAYFLVLPVLAAGLVLRPAQVWLVLVLALAGLALMVALSPGAPLSDSAVTMTLTGALLLLGIVAYLGFLSGRTSASALADARRARLDSETAAARLEQANVDLEARVSERTTALRQALAEVETRAAAQAHLFEENQQQRETIRDLSVPVLPINSSTLVMPLVGTLDSQRLSLAQEQALGALERARARYLVLDITGVPLVDSQVAQGLLGVVQAARLLGTEVVLVGVRPEVAQAIVGLGIDLRNIRTFSDLQSAIDGVVIA
jgi:rsbT co-antagonist protein RsbR